MNVLDRVRGWLSRQPGESRSAGIGELREFVYLDDVSVYSLSASRRGAIATQFTETKARSLSGEFEGSTEASAGFAKASVRGKSSQSQEQSSQVVRKAIIQSDLKDLYELEKSRLAPGLATGTAPQLPDGKLSTSFGSPWVVGSDALQRGSLIELEVELETEAIFRINAVISAFLEIVQEDLELFGVSSEVGVPEARAMNRVMDRLLTGLVPLRGRAVDLVAVPQGDREFVVHSAVLETLPEDLRSRARPLVVVGVAEQRLFWKDIRRVLFSSARYKVFCRIAQSGLRDRWSPIKLAEVIREVAPEFESQLLGAFGDSTMAAIGRVAGSPGRRDATPPDILTQAGIAFVTGLASFHGRSADEAGLGDVVEAKVAEGGYLGTTDGRRLFFGALMAAADERLAVRTPPETAAGLRLVAAEAVGLGFAAKRSGDVQIEEASAVSGERLLDSEFVAIYW